MASFTWMLTGASILLVCISFHARAAMDDSAPNENVTRRQIDVLIKSIVDGKKKATLGAIQQAIGLSISFGAPTYNQGDHEGCFRFYAKTAKSLCLAFSDEATTTPAARKSILDLQSALERSSASADVDRNAWSMRYAFDKTQLAITLHESTISGLVQIGSEYFKRAQFAEAQDAFIAATALLDELDGEALESIRGDCRFAPLALANAQFAMKKYREAVVSIQTGLKYFPGWPAVKLDLRSLHHDPAEYEDTLADLQKAAKENPADTALQFLLGYEYHYTGKRAAAREQFENALKADPQHAMAKLYLNQGEKPKAEDPSTNEKF